MFPRRWMLPSLHTSNMFREMDLFREKDSEVIRVKEDKEKLEVSLDTSQYRPDELRVSVSGRELCMEGRHEEKSEDGTRMVARQFIRRYVCHGQQLQITYWNFYFPNFVTLIWLGPKSKVLSRLVTKFRESFTKFYRNGHNELQ
jgi:Hsp20/alpha crystallin family